VLQLGELGIGRRADLDHRHLARQRADPFVEHVLVDAERRALQFGPQLDEPVLDLFGTAGAADDRRTVGGDPNLARPAELYLANLLTGTYIIEEARRQETEKTLVVGTICSYPKFTPVPFQETVLWDGYP